jgi:hypothetical protein
MEFTVKEVEDYGVLLSSHGYSEQRAYMVVWKNWSRGMFGQYNFNKEARESGCTYPAAIGPKGKSHEPVKAIIKADSIYV